MQTKNVLFKLSFLLAIIFVWFLGFAVNPVQVQAKQDEHEEDTGSITIIKEVEGDIPEDWDFDFSGDLGEFSLDNDDPSHGDSGFEAGEYTVTENELPDNWEFLGIECDSEDVEIRGQSVTIDLEEGGDVTCIFTNIFNVSEPDDHIAPTVTLIKEVINNNGGQADENDFGLTVGGTPVDSGQTLSVDANIPIEILELNLTGYSFVSVTGEGCPQNLGGEVILNEGEDIVCTITNDDIGGTLKVKKQTIGGFGTFGFTVSNENEEDNEGLSPFELTTSSENNPALESFFDVFVDVYNILEDNIPIGWDQTSATCDNGDEVSAVSIGLDKTVTCTFENTARGKIIVEKTVVGPDGEFEFSTDYSENFTLSDGEQNTSEFLEPGTYSVSEESNEDYTTTASCSDRSDPEKIELSPGETVTCTFTNTIKQGGITVVKQTFPTDTEQSFEFDPSWDEELNFFLVGNGDFESFDLDPGDYSVSEVNIPEGWDLTNVICLDQDDNSQEASALTLELDGSIACTFTNTEHGHLIVNKVTDPEESEDSFSISISTEGGEIFGDTAASISNTSSRDYEVMPGTYSVIEEEGGGWILSDNGCLEVTVGAGETIECTIMNVKLPVLTIVKNTVEGDGTFEFTVTNEENQTISTENGSGSGDLTLSEGTYNVVENVPLGWDFSGVICEYDGEETGTEIENGEQITVDNGDHVTCTFTNTRNAEPTDETPPVSTFDNDHDHEIIDTELVQLSLTGQSTDDVGPAEDPKSGVASAEMEIFKLADAETMDNEGFFTQSEEELLPFESMSCSLSESIPIEIVALSLTSVNPLTVSWGPNLNSLERGVYCLVVHATDEAGNIENTAVAGPFAYTFTPPIPTPSSGGGGGRGASGGRVAPSPQGQVLGAATEICNVINTYMRRGYRNVPDEVQTLQNFLNGYIQSGLAVDSMFGPKTENAVKAFQIARRENILIPWGLTLPTGIFYKTSLAEAKRLMCPNEFGNLPIPTDLIPWSKNPTQVPSKA